MKAQPHKPEFCRTQDSGYALFRVYHLKYKRLKTRIESLYSYQKSKNLF